MSQITSLSAQSIQNPHSDDDKIQQPSIIVKNSPNTTAKSFTPKTEVVYEKVFAEGFPAYVEKIMGSRKEQPKRNFINVVISSRESNGLFLASQANFTFEGQYFTNLNLRDLTHEGMVLKGCTLRCESRVMDWARTSLKWANFESIKINGKWGGHSSRFHNIILNCVNLNRSEINHVKFNRGDDGCLKDVALREANLNHIAFVGSGDIGQFRISHADLTCAVVNKPTLSYVCFAENVILSEGKWNSVMLDGFCDCSGLTWEKYQDNALNWHSDMFQSVEGLKKSLCPEQGAVFTRTLQTMKVKNSCIVVDSVNQMVRIIAKSPRAMNECLTSSDIRRALIAELRDPVYSQSMEIQTFRNTLLIHDYQCQPLRNDNIAHDEAIKLLQTLSINQKLQLQVVINQLVNEERNILDNLGNTEALKGLITYAKSKAEKFPHFFINEKTSEVICLSKVDFEQLIAAKALPKEPQLIRYQPNCASQPEIIPAMPEALGELRSSIPLFDTLWKRAKFSWSPTINLLFAHRDGLSVVENSKVSKISNHINSLLIQKPMKNETLMRGNELMRKVFSHYCGVDWQRNCEDLVGKVCIQFGSHTLFSSFSLNQQKAIAAIALIKLLVELSMPRYFGGDDDELAEGLLVPVVRLYSYAKMICPGLFTPAEKTGWDSALTGPGLQHTYNAQKFLSRIDIFKLPDGQEIKTIIDDMYSLP